MPPNVTQSFKLQRPDLENCRAEAMLRLFIAEHCFTAVVLKLGSIEPLRFDGAVSGVRRKSSDFSNPFLLCVVLGKMGFDKSLGNYVRVRRVCRV